MRRLQLERRQGCVVWNGKMRKLLKESWIVSDEFASMISALSDAKRSSIVKLSEKGLSRNDELKTSMSMIKISRTLPILNLTSRMILL